MFCGENAKVDTNIESYKTVMGIHGLGIRNTNRELLSELRLKNKLVIWGTLSAHKNIHKRCHLISKQNQIDPIIISRKWEDVFLMRNKTVCRCWWLPSPSKVFSKTERSFSENHYAMQEKEILHFLPKLKNEETRNKEVSSSILLIY